MEEETPSYIPKDWQKKNEVGSLRAASHLRNGVSLSWVPISLSLISFHGAEKLTSHPNALEMSGCPLLLAFFGASLAIVFGRLHLKQNKHLSTLRLCSTRILRLMACSRTLLPIKSRISKSRDCSATLKLGLPGAAQQTRMILYDTIAQSYLWVAL